ncbi:MAG: helix-turn-helix domain-containing protein [Cytophagaceae bacterium]
MNTKSDLSLLSPDAPSYQVKTFSDRDVKGNSEIKILSQDSSRLSFEYLLQKGYLYPYAGITLSPVDSMAFYDLSEYDHLKIKMNAMAGKRIPITLGLYVNNLTKSDDALSYRVMVKEIDILKGKEEYDIPLSEFNTPAWWYMNRGLTESDIDKPDFKKVRYMNVQSCQLIPAGVRDQIGISQLAFYKSNLTLYLAGAVFLAVYYVVMFILLYIKKQAEKVRKIVIQYDTIKTSNNFDLETEKVVSFISSNYHNPELSLKEIQLGTGISEAKITGLIKSNFAINFKQYLNKLRIHEAKRLLAETDLQISEIAYKAGYGNISHFNRVFREEEELSPNDYRKKAIAAK